MYKLKPKIIWTDIISWQFTSITEAYKSSVQLFHFFSILIFCKNLPTFLKLLLIFIVFSLFWPDKFM